MRVIGLTGGIGSGKSAVTALFRARGVPVVDADEVAHEQSAAGQAGALAVVAAFGAEAAHADGSLNRRWLRERAFADPAFRIELERLLHPLIGAAIAMQVKAWLAPYGIISAPLLLETGNLLGAIDRVLVVDVPETTQVERTVARGGIDAATVRAIMATQVDRATRLGRADDIIDNAGPPDALAAQVAHLDQRYRTAM